MSEQNENPGAGERDGSQRSGESAAASAGERDDGKRSATSAAEKAPNNTDGLSILALACAIAALVLTVFSVMPMLGWCFIPVGIVCAATALISGVVSVIRTTLNPRLEGRQQALAALGLLVLYGAGLAVLLRILARHSG